MVSNLLYSPDHPWAPDPTAPAFQVLWLTTAVCHHAQQHCVSWYSMSKRHKAKLSKDTRIVQKGTYFPNQGNESETTKKTVQGKQCSLKKKKNKPLKENQSKKLRTLRYRGIKSKYYGWWDSSVVMVLTRSLMTWAQSQTHPSVVLWPPQAYEHSHMHSHTLVNTQEYLYTHIFKTIKILLKTVQLFFQHTLKAQAAARRNSQRTGPSSPTSKAPEQGVPQGQGHPEQRGGRRAAPFPVSGASRDCPRPRAVLSLLRKKQVLCISRSTQFWMPAPKVSEKRAGLLLKKSKHISITRLVHLKNAKRQIPSVTTQF